MIRSFFGIILFTLFFPFNSQLQPAVPQADQITGKWISQDKALIVEIYKHDNEYRGKMVWFKDDTSKPMDEWTDKHNPDEKLRTRKLLGMDVMQGLIYNAKNNSYNDGSIYEAKTGKTWNASAKLSSNDVLKVKGYWHFKFIGRTMIFNRYHKN